MSGTFNYPKGFGGRSTFRLTKIKPMKPKIKESWIS